MGDAVGYVPDAPYVFSRGARAGIFEAREMTRNTRLTRTRRRKHPCFFILAFSHSALTFSYPGTPDPLSRIHRRNLPHATARWAAERAEGESRTPLVRAFAAFAFSFRLVSRARTALEDFLEDFLDGSGWARASISRVVVRERAARTDAVAKEHVGVRDRTEVRFVKGVPRFSKIASKIERDERDERGDEKKRGDENRRRGVLVTVDGRPVRGRAALRPGAILQIGGLEYEVLRDVRAHA